MFDLTKAPARRVVIAENFYANPDAVREFALAQEFRPNSQDHKGQRSIKQFRDDSIRDKFESLLGMNIYNWNKYAYNGVFQFCTKADQIVFHSDFQTYAAVVYLTPDAPPNAGTSIYRSRATKGRTPEESSRLNGRSPEANVKEMYVDKLLDPNAWETIDVIGNVYNRCAIWDARLVHAASSYFGEGKTDSRLFHMFFFDAD